MNRPSKVLAAMFLLAAILCPRVAQAMEIWQFDKMAVADQNEYVAELVVGAEKALRDEGKRDLALKVNRFFTTINPGSQIPLGVGMFVMNLARARLEDLKNVQKDPKVLRIEVEDVIAVTLRQNEIELPDSFYTVAKDWKPKFPPQKP